MIKLDDAEVKNIYEKCHDIACDLQDKGETTVLVLTEGRANMESFWTQFIG